MSQGLATCLFRGACVPPPLMDTRRTHIIMSHGEWKEADALNAIPEASRAPKGANHA